MLLYWISSVNEDPEKTLSYLPIRKITLYNEVFAIPALLLFQLYMYLELKKLKE